MLNQITFSFTQALQMVALVPCLLMIVYLIFMSRNFKLAIIPILYFSALSLGFLYYLLPAFGDYQSFPRTLMFGDLFLPVLSFLLIHQFLLNRIPPAIYWIILLIPLFSIAPIVYGVTGQEQLCFMSDVCVLPSDIIHLINIVISSFIFMLLILIVSRRSAHIIGSAELKNYKYWLVISLIIYSLFQLGMDLLLVAGNLSANSHILAKTMIKIAFIYMVMTSIFRVFTDLFDMRSIALRKNTLSEYEASIGKKIVNLMEDVKIYRDTDLNRAKLAQMVGVGEHLLSRIINIEFKKSFSDLSNEYRMREVKERLENTNDPVTAISFDAGFNSIASFNRVFKKMTGKSPSEFREDMQKGII